MAVPPPEQPGVSTEWRVMVMMADNQIPSPKPRWKRRRQLIVQLAFIREFEDDKGQMVPVDPEQGTYPNSKQIRHIITVETPKLILLQQQTTSGHFLRTHRGLTGKNWEGVAGPGHTWAIDSTVGDIYLRSSINRSWVIGRPIVYIIADVWSTAVVGFYVCLTGPSWDMAKISLFCSGADPSLIADLWGYSLFTTLDPHPTLAFVLMCDRGEYLSRAARQSGMDLRVHASYAPPYRPDLKGLIEVLHRIAKDEQFEFVPGSIDARRAEMERRKFDPRKAIFTVREYVEFLYGVFNHYNLTANREHRLDAHMRADGVYPSPAGLWRWGHQVGIGYRRAVPEAKLITDLLPAGRMTLTGSGVKFARALYEPPKEQHSAWATLARNFNRTHGTCHYFPGSPSRIWTPHNAQNDILKLQLSDQSIASSDCTFDEIADIYQYDLRHNARREHQNTLHGLDWLRRSQAQIDQARALTAEALEADSSPAPTTTQARQIEVAGAAGISAGSVPSSSGKGSSQEYIEMMNSILNSEPADA
jgi:putative transposase